MKKTTLLVALMLSLFVKANDTIVNLNLIPKIENGFYLHDETHYLQSSTTLNTQLLEFYIKKRNVTNITIEIGHATAYLANKYLETGNSDWLCKMSLCRNLSSFVNMIKLIKKLNDQYDKKVKIYGIDVHNVKSDWVHAIYDILSNAESNNDSINFFLNKLAPIVEYYSSLNQNNYEEKDLSNINLNIVFAMKRRLKQSFIEENKYLKSTLSENNYKILKYIILADRDLNNNHRDVRNKETNNNWSNNLHQYIDLGLARKGNFYGKFGSSHIRFSISGHNSFSKILNEKKDSRFYKKVVLCNTAYLNSYTSVGDHKAFFNKKNNYTYFFPREDWKRIKNKSYWFHQWRLSSQDKLEVVQRKFRKFPASFILYVRDDKPEPVRLKFCGDSGW